MYFYLRARSHRSRISNWKFLCDCSKGASARANRIKFYEVAYYDFLYVYARRVQYIYMYMMVCELQYTGGRKHTFYIYIRITCHLKHKIHSATYIYTNIYVYKNAANPLHINIHSDQNEETKEKNMVYKQYNFFLLNYISLCEIYDSQSFSHSRAARKRSRARARY